MTSIKCLKYFFALYSALNLVCALSCTLGSAEFSGDFRGAAFNPNGTVFSYFDTYHIDQKKRVKKRLVIMLAWPGFIPSRPLSEVGQEKLTSIQDEFSQREAIAIVFADADQVIAQRHYQTNEPLEAWINFPKARTNNESSKSVDVTIESFDHNKVAGTLSFWVKLEPDKGEKPKSAYISATFSAPLIEEIVAKSNLALLGQKTSLPQFLELS